MLAMGVHDEGIDALHIMGRQRNGMGGKALDARLIHLAQAIAQAAVTVHADAIIKYADALRSALRNLIGINMYMYIKYFHSFCFAFPEKI
jgi:hypothetical protein